MTQSGRLLADCCDQLISRNQVDISIIIAAIAPYKIARIIIAGIAARAALTMNTTIDPNGILISTIVTSLLFNILFPSKISFVCRLMLAQYRQSVSRDYRIVIAILKARLRPYSTSQVIERRLAAFGR